MTWREHGWESELASSGQLGGGAVRPDVTGIGYLMPVLAVALVEMLELTSEIHDAMVSHAKDGLPNEACGLFAATAEDATRQQPIMDGDEVTYTEYDTQPIRVARFFPMKNAAASETIYRFDPEEYLRVIRETDTAGLEIIGVMHSHPATEAYPSPTDVAEASGFDPNGVWHFVLVSCRSVEPELRSYRIRNGEILEEEVRRLGPAGAGSGPDL